MSVFDWVEIGEASKGKELDWFKGKCSVTVGDALCGYYGARHTHIFGPEIKVVCDLEDMLVSHGLEKLLPGISGLAAGIGGNVTFNYGSQIGLTYIGPKIDIRRANAITKIGKTLKKGDDAATNMTDRADKAVAIATGILSTLMLLTAAATELALHFAYPEFGKEQSNGGGHHDDASGDDDSHKHGALSGEMLKVLSYTITARLMELIKQIETSVTWGELGEEYLKSLKRLGLVVASPLLLAAEVLGLLMFAAAYLPIGDTVAGTVGWWGLDLCGRGADAAKYLAAV